MNRHYKPSWCLEGSSCFRAFPKDNYIFVLSTFQWTLSTPLRASYLLVQSWNLFPPPTLPLATSLILSIIHKIMYSPTKCCGHQNIQFGLFYLLLGVCSTDINFFVYTCEKPWGGPGFRWSFREQQSCTLIPGLSMFWSIIHSTCSWDLAVGKMWHFGWHFGLRYLKPSFVINWRSMVLLWYQKLISLLIAINSNHCVCLFVFT